MPARTMSLSGCVRKKLQRTRGLARPGAPCDRRGQAACRQRDGQGVAAQVSRPLPPRWQVEPTLHLLRHGELLWRCGAWSPWAAPHGAIVVVPWQPRGEAYLHQRGMPLALA